MTSSFRRLAVASLLAAPLLAGLAAPASASPSHVAVMAVNAPEASCPTRAACPYAKIVLRTRGATFAPRTLSAAATSGTCSSTNYSFGIFNFTSTAEQVTFEGQPYDAPIPAKSGKLVSGIVICTSAGRLSYGLTSNKRANLTVNVS